MRFDTSQHMRMSQQMKLAPRMIQSMEILQMPITALQERIEQELETNIALEQAEAGVDLERSDAEGRDRAERESRVGETGENGAADFARLDTMERQYGEAFDNEYSSEAYSPSRHRGERDGKLDAMANIAARGETLTEQLLHQWKLSEVNPELEPIGELIITYIDDDGLLSTDLEQILEQNRNVPGRALDLSLLERALHEVQQQLEPAGVGARSRRECLLLQISRFQEEGEDDISLWEDVRLLIEEHYDDLLQNRLPRIAAATELPMERIQAALQLMRKLDISPGRQLASADVAPVFPDIIIEYDEELDEYLPRLSDDLLPLLQISDRYAKMGKDRGVERETREFVNENLRRAHWLIDAINQRKATLLRVVHVVLARQREYFDFGPQSLKPMPMIDVADQLGIHVATVSRAVADKWMQTPRGVVPLRMFFSGGTSTDTGRDMSWEAVKATLHEIIDAEDKKNPMSDEALAAAMKEKGIDIARRTVVKYRQQLDIPPARRRKLHS